MENLNLVFTAFLFTLAILAIFMAVYSLVMIKSSIAKTFSFLCISFVIYSIGYGMELYSNTLPQMMRWNLVQFLGVPFIPVFWVILALQYTDRDRFLYPVIKLSLFIAPVLTVILRFTNQWHNLVYTTLRIDYSGLFPVLFLEKGPWYLVHVVVVTICFLYSSYLYYLQYRRASGVIRRQCVIMFSASILPWITLFPNLFNSSPYGIDFGPFLGSISCALFLAALFRYNFLNLKPLAREKVFQSTTDGIIVLDADYCIIDFNEAATRIIKSLNDDSISKNIQTVLTRKGLIEAIRERKEFRYRITRNGIKHHFSLRNSEILDKKGRVVGFLITMNDITDYVQTLSQLNELASKDELTKTYNRRFFFEQSSKELEKARKKKYGLSFIILDVDFFKTINDGYGHQAGDVVLQTISKICKKNIRSIDILGRYGGEEFIIFLPDTSIKDSVIVANRVKKEIEATEIPYEGKSIRVTASFGVTGIDTVKDETLGFLLKNADDALYEAKAAGRNRISVSQIAQINT